jgi:hypothetical protein
MRRLIPRALLVVALVAAAGVGTLAVQRSTTTRAATPQRTGAVFDGGARASAQAAPVSVPVTDIVSVYGIRDLKTDVAGPALAAATQAGGAAVITEGATIGLYRIWRGSQVARSAPAGYRYGLATSAVPTDAVGRIMGRDVATVLGQNLVVLSQSSAALRGALVGDVFDLQNGAGGVTPVRVGMIAPDAVVGGTELLMSPELFHALGYNRPDEVLIWGFSDRHTLDVRLAANGLVRPDVRIQHSWDPPNPDSTLSQLQEKLSLGEFAYAGSGDSITPDPTWRATYIFHYSWATYGGSINTYCNKVVDPAMRAALAEVNARGLGPTFDLSNINRYGGCYGPREVRPAGGTTGGSISRHSWGGAVDMNTVTNCMGCVPQMNCTVVQIFRKYGFAWGGNFLTSDGMHFEWVGQRRDLLSYPSRYCPNVAGVTQSLTPTIDGSAAPLPPAPTVTDSRDRILVGPNENDLGE